MKVRLPSLIFALAVGLAITPSLTAAPQDDTVPFTLTASPIITLESPAPAGSLTPRMPEYQRRLQPASERMRWDVPMPQQDLLRRPDARVG